MFTWEVRAKLGGGFTAPLRRCENPFETFHECEADLITRLDLINMDVPDCVKSLTVIIKDTDKGKRYSLFWRKIHRCRVNEGLWYMLKQTFVSCMSACM